VTVGIISALGRTNVGVSDYEDFIQTTPHQSGNSAAPWWTPGANWSASTRRSTRRAEDTGDRFAVPSNLAQRVIAI